MFGQNPIRSITTNPALLAVEDMFYTIQGEGPHSGRPALFIRLAGCNLACHFCDTQFETQAEKPRMWESIGHEIVERFTPRQRRFIVMTGGEPMRQNWSKLAEFLFLAGTEIIQVETAGTLWQDGFDRLLARIQFVCSPKTPRVHPRIEEQCHHWKYIVRAGEADTGDGLPMRGTQLSTMDKTQKLYRAPPMSNIWLSPCDEYDAAKNKANQDAVRDLCLQHGYRVSLQLHKLLEVA